MGQSVKGNVASPIDGAVSSIKSNLQKMDLELVGYSFGRQGNFTLCTVQVKKSGKSNKKIYTGYGMSKRNTNDQSNPTVGKITSIQRAIFGQVGQTGKTEVSSLSVFHQLIDEGFLEQS